MSAQVDLFHESPLAALTADVAALGGSKKVGPMLWPSKSDAAGRLRSSLDDKHAQKLDIEEMIEIARLARAVGSFATVNYLAQTLGFKFEWIKPEDHQAATLREIHEGFARIEMMMRRLQK